MSAYVLVDVTVTDPAQFEVYGRLAQASIAQYGGRYLVRGGASETLEGDWQPRRLVVLEFSSMAQARAWYDSAEYREARAIRHRCSRGDAILVEGA
jgi:uncharacterized protein (DUF1330 family)